jgi:hypothetical protein
MKFSHYIKGMKKITLVLFMSLLLLEATYAQISYPKVRKFNVGLFMGLGGQTGPVLNPVPVLNVSYRTTTLTAGASLNQGFTIGLMHEILPLSVSHYNVKWIASGFYSVGKTDRYYTKDTEYGSLAFLTGLKFYFGKRWFSNIQGGVSYTNYSTTPKSNIPQSDDKYSEWLPFFEFGIGIQLFKSFDEKKKKETTHSSQ